MGDIKSIVEKLEMIDGLTDYNRNVLEIMMDTVFEKDKLEKAQEVKMKKLLEELEKVRKR